MIAEAERVESMQADANILVIGIISHRKGALLKLAPVEEIKIG